MTVSKSEVVTVRVEPRIKTALQTAAEGKMRSVANVVEVMLVAYCRFNHHPLVGVMEETLLAAKPRLSPL